MANKRFNQQITQSRIAKMGGGIMNKRSMMKDGSTPRKTINEMKRLANELGKAAKRSSSGKGGGADTGKVGEMKSKLAVAGMKAKDIMGKSKPSLTKEQIEKLKDLFDRQKNRKEKFMKPLRRIENPKAKPMRNLKKGGRAALKKGSKFPDHSGDGKITQKDILMAKGVIPKKKNKKKVI
jgi:hypothetical protein